MLFGKIISSNPHCQKQPSEITSRLSGSKTFFRSGHILNAYFSILFTLLSESHFDEVLKFGFDKDLIFQYIVKEAIVPATEVMTDESFVMFGAWLKDHNDEASIEIVRDTLVKQGRTMELKRMNDRLAAQDKTNGN